MGAKHQIYGWYPGNKNGHEAGNGLFETVKVFDHPNQLKFMAIVQPQRNQKIPNL